MQCEGTPNRSPKTINCYDYSLIMSPCLQTSLTTEYAPCYHQPQAEKPDIASKHTEFLTTRSSAHFFIFCLEIAVFFYTIIEFQSSVCVCVKKGNTSLKIYCMSVTVWAVLTLQRSRDHANRALLESVQTFTVFQIGAGAGEEILKSCIYNFCL